MPQHVVPSSRRRLKAVSAWGAHSLTAEDAAGAAGAAVAWARGDPTAAMRLGVQLQNASLKTILDLAKELTGVDLLTPFERQSLALPVAAGSRSDVPKDIDTTPASVAVARRWAVAKYIAYTFLLGGMAVLPANAVAAATQGQRDFLHSGDARKLASHLHKLTGDVIAGGLRSTIPAATLLVACAATTGLLNADAQVADDAHQAAGIEQQPMAQAAVRDLTAACGAESVKSIRPLPPPTKRSASAALKLLPWLESADVERQALLGVAASGFTTAPPRIAPAPTAAKETRPQALGGGALDSALASSAADAGRPGGSALGSHSGTTDEGGLGAGSVGTASVMMGSDLDSLDGGGLAGDLGPLGVDEGGTGVGRSAGQRRGMAVALLLACCSRMDPRTARFVVVDKAQASVNRPDSGSSHGGRMAGSDDPDGLDPHRSLDMLLDATGPLPGVQAVMTGPLAAATSLLAGKAEAKRQAAAAAPTPKRKKGRRRLKKPRRRTGTPQQLEPVPEGRAGTSGTDLDAALAALGASTGRSEDSWDEGGSSFGMSRGGASVGRGGVPLPKEAKAAKRLGARNLYDGKWLEAWDQQLAVLMKDVRQQLLGGQPCAAPADAVPYLAVDSTGVRVRGSTAASAIQDGGLAVDALLVASCTPPPVGTSAADLGSHLDYLSTIAGSPREGVPRQGAR